MSSKSVELVRTLLTLAILLAGRAGFAGEGFTLESDDGLNKLRITAYAQADGRFFLGQAAAGAADTFLLRRVRPILQATLAGRFEAAFVPDFGGGQAVIQDAYLDARFAAAVRLRAGKFKAPFGLERLQSGSNLLFIERALPTSIAPNRDVGIQVHGEVVGGRLAYAAALQNGVPDGGSGDADTGDGKDVVLRLFALPLKGRTRGPQVGLGLAASSGRQEGPVPSYRSPAQQPFFVYAPRVAASGPRQRVSPQAYAYAGAFGLMAEYAVSRQRLARDGDRLDVTNSAWQVAASFFLTGEKAGWSAVSPGRPLDPARKHWGALQLAVRVHALDVDDDAFARGLADPAVAASKAAAWGVVLNWDVNRYVKYVVNFERTRFEGGGPAGGDRPAENALMVRAQLVF